MNSDVSNQQCQLRRRILLYGDVNLNILDGSAVWLVSMAEALSMTNSEVWVLLKAPIIEDRLTSHLDGLNNVHVVPHNEAGQSQELSPRFAAQRIAVLDNIHHFDIVISRGLRTAQAIATSPELLAKAWIYITDLPFPARVVSADQLAALSAIAKGARRLFAQTEDARSYLESLVPNAAGKTLLLPPMVPDEFFAVPSPTKRADSDELRLVYSGKFAKDWRTLEMCAMMSSLRSEGVAAQLTMVGDKFQENRRDPNWVDEMRAAIHSDEVKWVGGKSRKEALSIVQDHDIGLGWRTSALDSSLELSTKILEYAAAGVPPLLNRTAAHEDLFGRDYPLFTDSDDVADVLDLLGRCRPALPIARERARNIARPFSMAESAKRLEHSFRRIDGRFGGAIRPAPAVKVVLAGHDLKFAGELLDLLENRPDIDVKVDRWETLHKHDEATSTKLVEWADVIVCEWAGPNSVWYSAKKRPNQKLIVRLHAFELRGPWLANLDVSAIDELVCVSSHYRHLAIEALGIDPARVTVIPNALDCDDLRRAKKPDSHFRLGLIGIVPFLKRPDRALDVLASLLEQDQRYSLHIKGRMPWEYKYEWAKPVQREAYLDFFGRIGSSPHLLRRVVFEPFASDIGSWLRKIGYVLSPSTQESFHLAPAEGMASGAVPVVWDRPGAAEIFSQKFVVKTTVDAVTMIRDLTLDLNAYNIASQSAMQIASSFDVDYAAEHWLKAILDE